MEIYIPDNKNENDALASTTHLGVSAHQDDIEIMAYHGILQCLGRQDKNFAGVVVTNGSGSARSGMYANYTDEEMMKVRKREQNSVYGGIQCPDFLDYKSSDVKNPDNTGVVEDLKRVIEKQNPIIYTLIIWPINTIRTLVLP